MRLLFLLLLNGLMPTIMVGGEIAMGSPPVFASDSESNKLPKREEFYWQRGPYCGPNSLFVLGRLTGSNVKHQTILEVCEAYMDPQTGSSLGELEELGSVIGVDVEARFLTPDELEQLTPPYIVHLAHSGLHPETGHYITVTKFNPEERVFHLIDGSTGLVDMRKAGSFYRSFTGHVIVNQQPPYYLITFCSMVAGFAVTTGALTVIRRVSLRRPRNVDDKISHFGTAGCE